jgi:hypothetical protein
MGQLAQVVQQGIVAAGERKAEIGPLLLSAITRGRLGGTAPGPGPADLAPLLERLDRLDTRLEHAIRRFTTTAAGTGLAIGLSLILGAVILNPAVAFDGTVLVVGALTSIALGSLGLLIVRPRA